MADNGYVTERDGAIWFLNSRFGADDDSVLVRSGGGGMTYFATDIAYHYDKLLLRKFDRVMDVWGADHHGHEGRLRNAIQALGGDPSKLNIVLAQIVQFKEDGQRRKFSKRAGDSIMLDELIDEVGNDACIYNFLSRSHESQLEFDMRQAKMHSAENPVYYIHNMHMPACAQY